MKLQRQITNLNIQLEYQVIVDDMIAMCKSLFTSDLHSIYMCGSVPKGTAIFGESDIDFTIVFIEEVKSYYIETIEHIKAVLQKKYAFVSKVDIAVCSKKDVIINHNEWGFWIQTISICIFGDDLSTKLPLIDADKQLIIMLNKETLHVVERIINKLRFAEKEDEIKSLRRALTKRLIRAMFTLILDKVGYWSDDFDEIRDLLYKYKHKEEHRIRALYFFLENKHSGMDEYLTTVYGIENYIKSELDKL